MDGPSRSGDREATDAVAARARLGDVRAFDEAYRRVAAALFAWSRLRIHGALRSRLDPEDLVQEITLRALEGFASWDAEKGPFRGWLFGIAKHVLRRALERAAREAPANGASTRSREDFAARLPAETTAITRAAARSEQLERLLSVVDALPEDDRKLLMLRGLEGLPHEHVAVVLNLSPDAAAKRWQRLRERLAVEPAWRDIVAA
jgi:RNA polymerase sigma factor (sigma-70 family)